MTYAQTLAKAIAVELYRKLTAGEIDRINIGTIEAACSVALIKANDSMNSHRRLVDKVLHYIVVEMSSTIT